MSNETSKQAARCDGGQSTATREEQERTTPGWRPGVAGMDQPLIDESLMPDAIKALLHAWLARPRTEAELDAMLSAILAAIPAPGACRLDRT